MKFTDKKIKELLLKENYVQESDVKEAEKYAKSHKTSILDYLFAERLLDKYTYGQAVAEYFKVSYVDLNKDKIDDQVFFVIPQLVAKNKGVVAFERTDKEIRVGMTNPNDLETRHLIEKRFGQKVQPYYITEQDLEEALRKHKASLTEEFKKIVEELQDKNKTQEEQDETIVKMVDTLLQYGYENKTSDIHIEPYAKKILVRFRIDGVMHDVLDISKDFSELILTRIKVLSRMRTDEHRAAQDGKLRYKVGGETIDVRVSILPVTQGENIVMRLLSSKNRRFSLIDLGLADRDFKKVKQAIRNPHGMILVTGPTGSGKTTTLYAVMNILNKRSVNIATIEDPVEYDMEGVSQIQVNAKTGLTFAKGLRSIVRQDPDIIMVGEIRDEETAGIAINSALTGHLVLSTLHTNDAPTTLPRLLDMSVEPFLVASTLNVVVAQRLVRKVCSSCRISNKLTTEEKNMIESNPGIAKIQVKKAYKNLTKASFYKGKGCKVCNHTGYSGRIGVFEVLEMDEEIKTLIIKRASSDEIMKVARKNGMTTMLEDGVDKALNGETTIAEVLRVTSE